MPGRRVYIVGVGMTTFDKPGVNADKDYCDYALEAATKALLDCGLDYDAVEYATAGYVYGDSTYGQRALYQLGLTQIPIMNVNNNCSTGSTALYLARQAVAGGLYDCALALGFEKMKPGPLKGNFPERTSPLDKSMVIMNEMAPIQAAPINPQIFGNGAIEYCEVYKQPLDSMDWIASKNHTHSSLNPYAQFKHTSTVEEVQKARKIYKMHTVLHCSPPSNGSACAIVASEDFVKAHGLQDIAVEIIAQTMATDSSKHFAKNGNPKSLMELTGVDMTRKAAAEAYAAAGIKPADVDVIELHDCFSSNELITIDALGLCEPGKAGEWVKSGAGHNPVLRPKELAAPKRSQPINVSGGLISKGHPLGATGLAQATELTWQLRGWAGPRQVQGAKIALQHNVGLGGAVVVTIYKRGFGKTGAAPATYEKTLGYNPAVEARGITPADVAKVASKKAGRLDMKEELFTQDKVMQYKL
ncbi:thiolase-like protein [Hyaloraphidium curvatum]|nr:thiolase-like protein [Hyaloraphidium curvatum]